MAKCQVILTSLGIVAVTPPEKKITFENDSLLLLALILALLVAPFRTNKFFWVTNGEVFDIAHSHQSREVN